MARCLARGQRIRDQELILERADGTRLACSVSVEPQRDEEGVIQGAIAVLQDVTERRRAEELLGRQADLLAQTHDAIFAWAWDGTIVYWNRGAERLYGFSATEALGKKTFELLRPDAQNDLAEVRERVSREGLCTLEVSQQTRDGRKVIVESRLVLSRSFDAQPVVLETNRDITERKQFEAALRRSEEQLRLALEAGRVGTWDWDVVANRVTWSNYLFEIHGIEPANFKGTVEAFVEAVHPDDREHVQRAIDKTLSEGMPYSAEMRILRPGGDVRWIFTNGEVFREPGGKAVRMMGATVDITDRKRAEERLESAVRERTAKLRETVGELEAFSYSVSHDLRAPLRAMHGYAAALIEDAGHKLAVNEREYLQRISNAAQRLDRLINDVLTYSRLARTEVQFDRVDLDAVVRETLLQYPSLISAQARISVAYPLGVVLGHEALIVQVVSNLLSNAVKFVLPGVLPEIKVYSERHDEGLRLWVEDNGIGIAHHNHTRIFGMFQRLNAEWAYEGTGMGLSIVKKAAERMGGRVGVESDEGKGSRFWLDLKSA
jgi:PAS domain S-box-containing protein